MAKKGKGSSSQKAISKAINSPAEADTDSGMRRKVDLSKIPQAVQDLVKNYQTEIRADKEYYKAKFKRMREDMEYARLGGDKAWVDSDKYTVPIINRFINQAVAALYAKNPKAQSKRKRKLMSTTWDGTQEQAAAALQMTQMGADPTGENQQILQEVQEARIYNQMMDKLGQTLEILFEYFMGEDFPDVKKRMKKCVRRTKTTGVGYIELSFHRAMEPDPDVVKRIGDMEQEIQKIKALEADIMDGELQDDDVKVAELESMKKTLEEDMLKIVIEGLMFDFPRSTDIIPHRACTDLDGFIDADYVTREYAFTPDEVKENFGVDITEYGFKNYLNLNKNSGDDSTAGGDKEGDRGDTSDSDAKTKAPQKDTKGRALVWKMMHKKNRQELWLCDGYPNWLRPPAPPDLQVHGFWTLFALIFNEVEDEKEIYPPSDVHYLRHPQKEYNNIREAKREHRKANRPKYFVKAGALEEEDMNSLESVAAHGIIELQSIDGDMKIDQLIQAHKPVGIDPNLYETESVMKDVLYGVGAQSADLGQTTDSSATESNIAETSRMSTLASNVDDLDEFLSQVFRAGGQILLQQMNPDSVKEIVGPGAVWPQMNTETIMKELYLDSKMGSTGRPNQAQELANLERGMNFLIQLGGVNPKAIAKKYSALLDIDEEDLILDGLPSIVAMNAAASMQAKAAATGDPNAQPGAQGPQGANNAPGAPKPSPQGQPAFPAPTQRFSGNGAPV